MTVMSLPSRHTPSLTDVPGFMPEIMRVRSLIVSTFLPSTLLITSPDWMPAAIAALSGVTWATRAPLSPSSDMLLASSSFSGWICTPSRPRSTRPLTLSWSTTGWARLAGMAKPRPTLPPDGEKMAVLMPITLPSMSNSGPPELPRLMAASVWM